MMHWNLVDEAEFLFSALFYPCEAASCHTPMGCRCTDHNYMCFVFPAIYQSSVFREWKLLRFWIVLKQTFFYGARKNEPFNCPGVCLDGRKGASVELTVQHV